MCLLGCSRNAVKSAFRPYRFSRVTYSAAAGSGSAAVSYKIGYGDGLRGLPYRCPWWADSIVCGLAYIDGRKAYLECKIAERHSSNGD